MSLLFSQVLNHKIPANYMIICKLCIGQVQTAGVMDVMFQPMPSVVYLQNYEPRKTYQVPLFFRNLHVVTSIVGSVLDTV